VAACVRLPSLGSWRSPLAALDKRARRANETAAAAAQTRPPSFTLTASGALVALASQSASKPASRPASARQQNQPAEAKNQLQAAKSIRHSSCSSSLDPI